ncbi:MAG: TRAP transporter fused permease subunit [Clostridia bacterium]|nr:TRAP transporter fused permease subunit [Clostridia bacterium]
MQSESTVRSAEEIMKAVDRESNTRAFTGIRALVLKYAKLLGAIFMISLSLVLNLQTEIAKPIFMGMILMFTFFTFPAYKKQSKLVNHVPWYDYVLIGLTAICYFYPVVRHDALIEMAKRIGTLEIIIALVALALLVEACRRAVGAPILFVAGGFCVYAFIYLSKNPVTMLRNFCYEMFFNVEGGIFSTPISVCINFIILFIILGSFLEKTGIGQFFVDLANSIAGASAGGPAKVAVISSALEGMYSGSSVANTVGSGSVTIPIMKKSGYKPEFAAAVEAAASTGGQIMPPIMGAAAFLMAEITGVPYATIAIAAILPALLYFSGIFIMVHFEAKKLGLKGLPKDAIPNFFKLLLTKSYLLLPVVVLVICMNYFTAGMSACYAILTALVVGLIDTNLGKERFGGSYDSREAKSTLLRGILLPLIPILVLALYYVLFALGAVGVEWQGKFVFFAMIAAVICSFFTKGAILTPSLAVESFENGITNAVGVSIACGIAGIISGVVTLTALGSTLVSVIVPIASKNIMLALFLTMLACIVLGMGVPTTANYIIMATTTAPILIAMGIPVLAAHMFVFYFGIVADITPPVALAAYAGSAIAGSNPLKTGVIATRLAITAFIIPYIFALSPDLLLVCEGYEAPFFTVVRILITSLLGIVSLSAALEGFLVHKNKIWETLLFAAGGLMLIMPDPLTDIIGVGCIALAFLSHVLLPLLMKKKEKQKEDKKP